MELFDQNITEQPASPHREKHSTSATKQRG
jgi:hypothetical protein